MNTSRGDAISPTHSPMCEAQPGAHVPSQPPSAQVSPTKKTRRGIEMAVLDAEKLWAFPSPYGDGKGQLRRRSQPSSRRDRRQIGEVLST